MAEYEERSLEDLTEEPSAHRLEQLRAKGQVAQSRELTGTIALLAVMLTLYFLTTKFVSGYAELLKEVFSKDFLRNSDINDWRGIVEVSSKSLKFMALAFFPVALASIALSIITSVAQTGFLYSTELLEPDFNRVNPINGFMRIFSLKSLTEGLKSTLKIVALGGIIYGMIQSELLVLPSVVSFGASQILAYIGATSMRVFGTVACLLLVMAGIDYWIQWRRFRQQAMMTKQEARQELKEREGDPQIKARIRTIQRDMARKRMMKSVPKADVVITNPTHIAVAIIYDPEEGHAPKVVAKGADFLAERIKKVAREHGVPTVENKPLARTLYKHVKVGQMIPRTLYKAVAEILAYVYKLKGRKLGAGSPGPGPSKSV